MRYLLDSVIVIDHFNNIMRATKFILNNKNNIILSVITRAEVLTGFNSSDAKIAKLFMGMFPILPIAVNDADRAVVLRQEHGWKLPDAFQAAIAINHKLRLMTRNTKDFSETKHQFVKVPYHM